MPRRTRRERTVLPVLAATAAVFLLAGIGPAGAAFPGANGKIASVSDRDGDNEIFVMEPDGSAQTQLTTNADGDFAPAWSPDGSKIAFMTDRDNFNLEVYVMNADGSGQTNLSQNPSDDGAPTWSPDGSKIAFRTFRDGSIEIFAMNADGSGQTNLTQNPASDEAPAWSPDGSKIAFYSDRDGDLEVYVMNADGSGQTNLSQSPGTFDVGPEWSPDGSMIAFTRFGGGGDSEVYVMNADGSGQTNVTQNPASDGSPAWSPDGTKIAFTSDRDGASEIYVMNADGSGQANLSQNAAFDVEPNWQALAPPTIEVEIDVKPGSDQNPVNLKSNGVIPVAILTTDTFDALSVDPLSVAFGPAGAAETHGRGHADDVDGDGDLDLVLHFRTPETGLTPADTEACLTGTTFGGDDVEGCDGVTTK